MTLRTSSLVLSVAALACRAPDSKAEDPGEQHAAGAREALVGRLAPAAALDLLDGERVLLRDLVGRKPVYIKFWATWCVPCQKQMPHLEAAHRKYGDRIAMFAVDLGLNDSVEAVREFRAEHAMTVPIAIDDGTLAESFRVAVTPQHVLVDRAGIIRYLGHGATAELDRALESLLRDEASSDPPRPAELPDAPLSLTLLDGSTFTLAAHAGRPIALTFVKTSCDTYMAESRPAMAEACAAHARQVESLRRTAARVVWVTIAHPVWTSTQSLDAYRKRLAVSSPIGRDETSTWFRRFRVREVPTTILLDGRGAEIMRVSGRGDGLPRALALLR
jgi:thiol-disulfide isomerase/thioredoxin